LSIDPDGSWGPTFTAVLYYGRLFNTFGLDRVPYTGQGIIAACIFGAHVATILLMVVAYILFRNGDGRGLWVKRVIYAVITLDSLCPYVVLNIAYNFTNCDFINGVLLNNPTIQCWAVS
jgi:hypothetical protein